MTRTQYIGRDVHKESISIAVINAAGKIVMECVSVTRERLPYSRMVVRVLSLDGFTVAAP